MNRARVLVMYNKHGHHLTVHNHRATSLLYQSLTLGRFVGDCPFSTYFVEKLVIDVALFYRNW